MRRLEGLSVGIVEASRDSPMSWSSSCYKVRVRYVLLAVTDARMF
jgi:hypothetical protein